jgi:hypothetical protein
MWTNQNRARYDRSGLRYPSDLNAAEWAHDRAFAALLAPSLSAANSSSPCRPFAHRENLFGRQRQRTPKETVTTRNDARDRPWSESPAVTPGYVEDFHRRPEARQNAGMAGGACKTRTADHLAMLSALMRINAPEARRARRARELHGRRQKRLDFWLEESVSVFVGERRLERA